jgi:hypothetical protein
VDDLLEALVASLSDASIQAQTTAGAEPVGVRAVEPARGQRWYLCAFDGPRFLCLDASLRVERDRRRVRQAATCALLVEHVEGLIEPGELDILASASSALATHVEAADLRDALGGLAAAAVQLSNWCAAPDRAIASLAALESGIQLHDAARRQYERFVEGTEPLVAIQDRLADELIAALRDVEEAAGRAGIVTAIPGSIAQAMQALDTGAAEILAKHVTPLDGDATD